MSDPGHEAVGSADRAGKSTENQDSTSTKLPNRASLKDKNRSLRFSDDIDDVDGAENRNGGVGADEPTSETLPVDVPESDAADTDAADKVARKPPKKKRKIFKRIFWTLFFILLTLFIAAAAGFFYLFLNAEIPEPHDFTQAEITRIYYNDGATEMGSYSEVNRTIIDTSTLPDHVGNAIVASEDRTFYTNSGIDLQGIARAFISNVTTGSRQGGSTLSQQYVENYYVGEPTLDYVGKLNEAILALKINRFQEKEDILSNYMNTIYFGRGAYGIEAAADAYYGIPAAEMNLSQSAMLAGIIAAPSGWDPAVNEEQARRRWQRVLNFMVEDQMVSQADVDGIEFPETVDPTINESTPIERYLLEQARTEILDSGILTEEQLEVEGLTIVTTIDPEKQAAALESLNVLPEDTPDSVRVALSSIDNETGEILAEYPGEKFGEIYTNAVTQDIAAAGSTFKPFGLLNYLQTGGELTDTFDGSSPQYFSGSYIQNNDNYSFGMIDLITATQYSVNTAYVNMNSDAGSEGTLQALIDAGIPADTLGLDGNLANVLGSATPHNIDLTRAYGTLANGGRQVEPHIVREVKNSDGNVVFRGASAKRKMFTPQMASAVLPALEAVVDDGGTGEKVANMDRHVAGKTGTSDNQESAIFAGFTPKITTVVSMYGVDEEGNPVSLPNIGGLDQFHGGDWPVDMWVDYMSQATKNHGNSDFEWRVNVAKRSTQSQSNDGQKSNTKHGANVANEGQTEENRTGEGSSYTRGGSSNYQPGATPDEQPNYQPAQPQEPEEPAAPEVPQS